VATYLDTSALLKWYVRETRSEDFARFMADRRVAASSRLTVLEIRSALARLRREKEIGLADEARAYHAFRRDILDGFVEIHPVEDADFESAAAFIERLAEHPLRSLDSLHLAVASRLASDGIATADLALSGAAQAIGLPVIWFGR
jgi:uncharacterized protein